MALTKRKVGRPKTPASEKVVYARVPVQKQVYDRLKANITMNGLTFTEKIDQLLDLEELQNK